MRYFVRWSTKDGRQCRFFADYQSARSFAEEQANAHKGRSYYHGSEGCHPLDEHYFQHDSYFGRAVEFCCND